MNWENSSLGVGTVSLNANAYKYVKRVLDTRRLSYGPFIQRFEREFSRGHDVRYGVMVNSGTSALQLAVTCLYQAHGWKPGDEVIVPAVTFVASSNVIVQQGLRPIFVDVDPRTYNIDPSKIEEKITKRTRAIMVVHLFGQPAEMDPILKIAKKYHLRVIEDSCETLFTRYKGKSVGSMGDIGCFSTYIAHLLVTGVGGVVVTNRSKYAIILRSLANHGRDSIYTGLDDVQGKRGKALHDVVERRFKFVRNGYSYRVTEFEGALGCAQLELRKWMFKRRKENAKKLLLGLAPLADRLQLPWHPAHSGHAFMMFPIVIRPGIRIAKRTLINFLEDRGIETRDMLPLVNQPFYRKDFGVKESDYPVAKWINQNGFYIGCHQEMRTKDLNYIINQFKRFFKVR